MEKPMNGTKLPRIDSVPELAQFWNSHDLSDFEDQLEEIEVPIFKREATMVRVALQPNEIEAVTELANSKGVKSADLIREWILERIETS